MGKPGLMASLVAMMNSPLCSMVKVYGPSEAPKKSPFGGTEESQVVHSEGRGMRSLTTVCLPPGRNLSEKHFNPCGHFTLHGLVFGRN